jgi:hypothetical protein
MHLAHVAAGARVGHEVHGVEVGLALGPSRSDLLAVLVATVVLEGLDELLGDLLAAVRPDVQQLVVALAGGDDAAVVVLLDAIDLLLGSSSSSAFSAGMRRSVMPNDRPASVDCLNPISFMRSSRSMVAGLPQYL